MATRTNPDCCLCCWPLLDASALKKYKCLYGESCEKSKQLLDELISEHFCLPLCSFVETKNATAFLHTYVTFVMVKI